ncbi:beta-N-acetylhexosaminidase [Flavobacteriaceae bacterium M23B6Z8]
MSISLHSIIPKPVYANEITGKPLQIDNKTIIFYDLVFEKQAAYLSDLLYQQTDLRLVYSNDTSVSKDEVVIKMVLDQKKIDKAEMYQITVGQKDIELIAADVGGAVYAIHTLMQLIPIKKARSVFINLCEIKDYPRFAYRGMHLDVSRHFFEVPYVKKYIDYLAYHKFNYFHWHLTDDQGWRIEIKKYPKLTSVGAWRKATLIGHFFDEPARYHEQEYGGYYTQKEIKEVIQYALERGITVIPEIDIPGHSRAAIAAYPELGTNPETTFEVATTWGMFNRQNNVLAPNPETFRFIEAVFAEVCELFPAGYIHIGGDECSKIWWQQNKRVQEFMRQNHLNDEKELQTYIVNRTAKFVESRNKKVIAWHDVLEGEADKSVIVMNWGSEEDAIKAVEKGYKVIATPGKPLYFDHYQQESDKEPLAIHGCNTWQAVYDFEPVPPEIEKTGKKDKILGAQGNVWTEYMGTTSKVEYMMFPRMTALSEVLWSAKKDRDLEHFRERLEKNALDRYRYWGASHGPMT